MVICGEDWFCNEWDELVEVMLLVEILSSWILIVVDEDDDGIRRDEILCWEDLLLVFIVSGVAGDWIGRHSISGILVLRGIGEEVEFL